MKTCSSYPRIWVIALSGHISTYMVCSLLLLLCRLLLHRLLPVMQLAVSQPKGKGLGGVQPSAYKGWLSENKPPRGWVRTVANLHQL